MVGDLDFSGSLLGKESTSVDELYDLYCRHALALGFSVRKGTSRYKKGSKDLHEKYLLCSCEGKSSREKGKTTAPVEVKQRMRVETRTGCCAMVRIKEKNGVFVIVDHVISHNHDLTRRELSHHHRCQRQICDSDAEFIERMQCSGIRTVDSFRYMCVEAGGEEHVGHTLRDHYNFVQRLKMSAIDGGDAQSVVDMLEEMDSKDAEFFFRVRLDEKGRLCNVFWRDALMKEDFKLFGDVTIFDTTYRTNKYNLICAPFVGINNHWKNVMFGCAFLSDEKTESFEWLFKTFRKAMGGLSPKSIFTDQDMAMNNALEKVFPDARHRLCLWHIQQNAVSHFGRLKKDFRFKEMFNKCLSGCVDEREFMECWTKMITDFNLGEDSWFKRLFQLREKWCTALSKDFFSAGILSSQRSESTNNAIGFNASKTTRLSEFFEIFKSTVERWRSTEALDEFNSSKGVKPCSSIPISGLLKHAFELYTLEVYKDFEFEFFNAIAAFVKLLSGNEETCRYMVSLDQDFKNGQEVSFSIQEGSLISCTCKNFEQSGWLCFHCLRVFHMFSISQIPDRYIVRRWTKYAKSEIWNKFGGQNGVVNENMSDVRWRQGMMRKYYSLLLKSEGNEETRRVVETEYRKLAESVERALSSCILETETSGSVGVDCVPNSILNPPRANTKGRSKRALSHLERKRRRLPVVGCSSTSIGGKEANEFGSFTPNPRLF